MEQAPQNEKSYWWDGVPLSEFSPDDLLEKEWTIKRESIDEELLTLSKHLASLSIVEEPDMIAIRECSYKFKLASLDRIINDTYYYANKSYNPKTLRDHHQAAHDKAVNDRKLLMEQYQRGVAEEVSAMKSGEKTTLMSHDK